MAFVSQATGALRWVKNRAGAAILNLPFKTLDIAWQKRRLKGYGTGIIEEITARPVHGGVFAFFVYYDCQASVPDNIRRLIQALNRDGANIVLVCNNPLPEGQARYFLDRCHTILLRDNQGFDFGGYKDAVNWARRRGCTVDRAIFLNDSVFFSGKGLAALTAALQGAEDVIGVFENWGEDYHICSYALSVSGHVFASEPFRDFWSAYVPVSNRIHCIDAGEKQLSRAALGAARSSRVIFGTAALYRALLRAGADPRADLLKLPRQWRSRAAELAAGATPEDCARLIADIVNSTSPPHAGAYYFSRLLGCPLLKKDIVYRQRFAFWEVESWIADILDPGEAGEFLTVLRRKGDHTRLTPVGRLRYRVGVA